MVGKPLCSRFAVRILNGYIIFFLSTPDLGGFCIPSWQSHIICLVHCSVLQNDFDFLVLLYPNYKRECVVCHQRIVWMASVCMFASFLCHQFDSSWNVFFLVVGKKQSRKKQRPSVSSSKKDGVVKWSKTAHVRQGHSHLLKVGFDPRIFRAPCIPEYTQQTPNTRL